MFNFAGCCVSLRKDITVSVIFPCYNAGDGLEATIGSVLEQSLREIELICVDDCSYDSTYDCLVKWQEKDNRIVVLKNEKNIGLTKSLNRGIKIANGRFIARIDVGDIYFPEKLKKQVEFLNSNVDCVVCATQVCYIGDDGVIEGYSTFANVDEAIRKRFLTRESIFSHPSIMFRNKNIFYDERYRYSQDLELYMNLSRLGNLYCLPDCLVKVWNNNKGLTVVNRYYQRQYQNILYNQYVKYYRKGKLPPSEEKFKIQSTVFGKKLCFLSMIFFYRYKVLKSGGNSRVLWGVVLLLALFLYPPFFGDYLSRLWCCCRYGATKKGEVRCAC